MEVIAGGDGLECRLSFDVSQNVAANTTTLLLTRMDWRKAGQSIAYDAWCIGSVSANGTVVKEFILTDTVGYPVSLTSSWSGFACDGAPIGTHSGAIPVTVSHEADGTRSVSVAFAVRLVSQSSYSLIGQVQQTVAVTLPAIPRVSGISASGAALGNAMTITLTRAASGFRDSVSWTCGNQSGTIAEKSAETTFHWTPPVSLSAQNTQGVTVPVTLRVTTFSGSQTVGSRELTVTCRVPESVVPTASLSVSDGAGYASVCGGYVQDQSRARVVTAASGVYGSSVISISVSCGSLRGAGADVSFALPSAGSVTVSVTVKDSRGRSATASTTITVLAYSRPTAVIRQAYRCNASGTEQADGAYLRLVFDAAVTRLTGNTASYQAVTSVHGGGGSQTAALTNYSGSFSVSNGSAVLPAGADSSYDCLIRVTDRFQTCDSAAVLVPVAFLLLDLDRNTRAVGIGMRAAQNRKLCVGLDMDMNEHRVGNLALPVSDGDAATKAYVDSRPAPNLLDNWYFGNPVNQRGATNAVTGAYFIDRWRTNFSSGSVTLTSAGIQFTKDANGLDLFQKVEPSLKAALVGKQLTMSALFSDGTMIFDTRTFGGSSGTEWFTASGNLIRLVWYGGSGAFGVLLNKSCTIVAIKLEIGSNQTLCHRENNAWVLNEVPDYGEQLARCQRYYQKFNGVIVTGYRSTGDLAYLSVPTSVSFRAKPAASNLRFLAFRGNGTYGMEASLDTSQSYVYLNDFSGMIVRLSSATFNAVSIPSNQIISGDIYGEFSADL